MKTKNLIILVILLVVVFPSCKITTYTYSGKDLGKIGTIALLATYCNPPQYEFDVSWGGLADKVFDKHKIKNIADQIVDLQKLKILQIRDTITKCLKNEFNWNVINSDQINNSLNYDTIKKYNFTQNLKIHEKYFDSIITAPNDINICKFTKQKGILNYYYYELIEKSLVVNLCNLLHVDLIALINTNIRFTDVPTQMVNYQFTGGYYTASYQMILYIYDKNGDLFLSAIDFPQNQNNSHVDFNNIITYQDQYNTILNRINPMINKLSTLYKSKQGSSKYKIL